MCALCVCARAVCVRAVKRANAARERSVSEKKEAHFATTIVLSAFFAMAAGVHRNEPTP
jgi:hypothetical protein